MAVLRESSTGRTLPVPDRCVVGRSRVCDLVLAAPDVSGEHASLRWSGGRWELLDLGSRNGTFVDGARLDTGTRVAVTHGAQLRFGTTSPAWELVDDAAPQPLARSLAADLVCTGDGGYLAFPDVNTPEYCVYQASDGTWLAEHDGDVRGIDDRAVVPTRDGATWRVHLPQACAGTWTDGQAPLLLVELLLRFTVSADEEHVELLALHGERRFDLQARAHHYPLLLLARRRLADRDAGVPEPEQGWLRVDELTRMLKVDEGYVNLAIHRARTQFGKLGVTEAAALIERRTGTRQLRLGPRRLEVLARR